MRRLALAACFALAVVACPGCGTSPPTAVDGGSALDAALRFGVTPSPDGLGYCCRMSPRSSSCFDSARFGIGGFEVLASYCGEWNDVHTCSTSRMLVDGHGCPGWDLASLLSCCGFDGGGGAPDGG